ncbi:ATP-binding cassette domain-containing protein [Kitasatospora sp. NPDC088346]|uniref:ATP-binding cassette domain-containing protein n=1 Tax=Kitasatospora sp. NPDC088346 TaxID=3364073 RepID=UPI0038281700
MIQTTGLTKVYRRGRPPALLDLTFDARPGAVTALLGAADSGKTTALRLMVELERGQGVALFGGRTYRTLRRPEREVGVLFAGGGPGEARQFPPVGHPGRRAHSHLLMLAAAVGVPARRADELLEQTRLATVADQRLRSFSPGMNRRLALAGALLGSPGTLVLDAPTEGLSPRGVEWFHSFFRSFAVAGGTVLATTRSPEEAAALADRVITLDQGRLVADQPVTEFRRTRLGCETAVRGPQIARLADLLVNQGAEVRPDGTAGIAVSGIGRTEIGELAYRHGILLHELADRVAEQPVPRPTLPTVSGRSGQVQLQAQAEDQQRARRHARPTGETETPSSMPMPMPMPSVHPSAPAPREPLSEPGHPDLIPVSLSSAAPAAADHTDRPHLSDRPLHADRPHHADRHQPADHRDRASLADPLERLDHFDAFESLAHFDRPGRQSRTEHPDPITPVVPISPISPITPVVPLAPTPPAPPAAPTGHTGHTGHPSHPAARPSAGPDQLSE